MKAYLGIDNGVTGALAFMSAETPVSAIPMPIQVTRKGNEIDVRAVKEFIEEHDAVYLNMTVVIEEPGGSQNAKAATSMAGSFHALRAIVEMMDIKLVRITPAQWQTPLLKCKKKEQTKPVAAQMAKSLWPYFNFLSTARCRVPHDGMIDAMLIAEWARRNNI